MQAAERARASSSPSCDHHAAALDNIIFVPTLPPKRPPSDWIQAYISNKEQAEAEMMRAEQLILDIRKSLNAILAALGE